MDNSHIYQYQFKPRHQPIYSELINEFKRYTIYGPQTLTLRLKVENSNIVQHELYEQPLMEYRVAENDYLYLLLFYKLIDDACTKVENGFITTTFQAVNGIPMVNSMKMTCSTYKRWTHLDRTEKQKTNKQ